MKCFLVFTAALILTGCSNGYEKKAFPVLPEELKDCQFFRVSNTEGIALNVVRCPNSSTSTTYSSGKTTATTVVIDGKKYIEQK